MKITLHKIGNKILGEEAIYAEEELSISKETEELLENYFLGSFKGGETYQFYSDTYLTNNPVFNAISEIFEDKDVFLPETENIARHLFDVAENPRVQGGELFVVHFISEDEEVADKIGIFKTEKLEPFLKIENKQVNPIEVDRGFSLNKIDKASLITNQDKDTGFIVEVVDNNKNGDMYYWFEDFLKVRQREDAFFQTQESMSVFKDYIKKQLPQEFEVSKVNQVEFLNKALTFLKEKEEFNLDEFTTEILKDETVIESFNDFKTDYEQEMQINIAEKFVIDADSVKKNQKHFKNLIKLDKNFEIKVNSNENLIEEGSDEKGKFYKIYFEKEN